MTRYYINDKGERLVDRRSGEERRKQKCRREEIRFEPGRDDRRSGKDRRKVMTGGWNNAFRK